MTRTETGMTPARQKMLWEHNRARAYNRGITAAINEVYHFFDSKKNGAPRPLMDTLWALEIPYEPPEIVVKYERRDVLLNHARSDEEEAELKSLRKELDNYPRGCDPQDQEARDYIQEAARLLRKHEND